MLGLVESHVEFLSYFIKNKNSKTAMSPISASFVSGFTFPNIHSASNTVIIIVY